MIESRHVNRLLDLLRTDLAKYPFPGNVALSNELTPDDEDFFHFCRRSSIDGLFYRCSNAPHAASRLQEVVWREQRCALTEILAVAAQSNVEFLIFKSVEIVERFYASVPISIMGDIDAMVRTQDFQKIKAIFRSLGYVQGYFDFDLCEMREETSALIEAKERDSYEAISFVKIVELDPFLLPGLPFWPDSVRVRYPLYERPDGVPILLIAFDIHVSLADDIDPSPLWSRAKPGSFPGSLSLSDADHLWFLCTRFYLELAINFRQSCYRDLFSIFAMLRHGSPDWNLVVHLAKTFESRPPLFYVLSAFREICSGEAFALPPGILAALDPRRGSRARDWGWQIPKMLGLVDKFTLSDTNFRY